MEKNGKKAWFITIEGPEGAGKSTCSETLVRFFEANRLPVICTREPGGTPMAEKLRAAVKNKPDDGEVIHPETELLLMEAARAQHVREKIAPALAQGISVICDRFSDSTLVYQGLTRGLKLDELGELRQLNAFASNGLVPDMTLLLDGRPEVLAIRRDARGVSDRYENKGLDFQHSLRNGFLALAKAEPERIKVINAEGTQEEVQDLIMQEISALLEKVKA